jgi:hypothetical protein
MHCEIVVPGLLAAKSGRRLPALELLLARGRARAEESRSLERWLPEAFGLEEGNPAGALTAGEIAGTHCWARADPVHLRLMRDRLIVVPAAAFPVSAEEAGALVDSLNAHFAGKIELHAVQPKRWCARFDDLLELDAEPPLLAAGRDVKIGQPRGSGNLEAFLNEVQMLLHAHPVNEAREAKGEAAINSLWFWGSGRAPETVEGNWASITADDPIALGLARLAGARCRPVPASAAAWLDRSPEEGRHLVVLDTLREPAVLAEQAAYGEALDTLEKDWFAPMVEALRAGRVGMVSIHVPDGPEQLSFETIRGDLRRFWRRPRPLERYA